MKSIIEVLSNSSTRLTVLIAVCFLLYLMENGIPFKRNNRNHLVTNITLTVLAIALNLFTSVITISILDWAAVNHFGLLRLLNLNIFATITISILFLDFWSAYFNHWIMHKIPFLWKFHSVHHADTMIDVTSALRHHPFEIFYRMFFQITGALILGIPFWVLGFYILLSVTNGQLEHANISFPEKSEKFLRHFYITPDTHKVHHSKLSVETNSNYGNLFSIWDRIFKTYKIVDEPKKIEYGLEYVPDEKSSNSLKSLLMVSLQRDKEQKNKNTDIKNKS
jgi:sterol desaturase/sphingolipid hydroxylase (fatty acid hydroxylase superfamily)